MSAPVSSRRRRHRRLLLGLATAVAILAPAAPAAHTLTIVAQAPTGTGPLGVAVDPATGRVFVANNGSNNVTVIDAATLVVVSTLVGFQSPLFTGAADPVTRRVFIGEFNANRVSVIHDETDDSLGDQVAATGASVAGVNANTNAARDAVNANTNNQAAATNQRVDGLASRVGPGGVGFNTAAFCAEGSVRNDGQGKLQLYVTLFSKTSQTVTINYITNKGTRSKSVNLQAGVRFTDDANAYLSGPNGQFPNAPDVDTSVEVTAQAPVFLACPEYFDRQIGILGQVSGGTVQDGSHN